MTGITKRIKLSHDELRLYDYGHNHVVIYDNSTNYLFYFLHDSGKYDLVTPTVSDTCGRDLENGHLKSLSEDFL